MTISTKPGNRKKYKEIDWGSKRKIGGQVFRLWCITATKHEATSVAEHLRSIGNLARVNKTGRGYMVWKSP